ncbi:UNVERIFIED_CONTAM: LINE-1 retrotransposable element O protein [Sesamum angustifolium]|uniref:LINE-1 retrotransposable element O protein n=1 Tax=Sesamum angustifolium TaxID=2727405 RepID=A0AAW2KES6_9LAMI
MNNLYILSSELHSLTPQSSVQLSMLAAPGQEEESYGTVFAKLQQIMDMSPWIIGGDFNIILTAKEKRGGAYPKFRAMEEFADTVLECGLIDAGFEGSEYTWSNRITWERLDRFFYSEAWLDVFTSTRIIHLSRTWSDHAPLLINLEYTSVKPPSSFRFMRMWTRHHDLLNTIEQSWKAPTGTYDSAAGPDGFSALFYQVTWDIIAQDVTAAVQDFFCRTPLPKSFKATSIALIPKMSMILPGIIASLQSGFVGGRLISDNISLPQELIHSIGDKKRYDNVVFKLDMAKAYDRVQWRFLYQVMRKMGFNEKWIQLITNCIEHCWFSVLINGDKVGFFQLLKGLRQGDPISPSLFIIVAEFLARGLDRLFQQNPALGYCNKGGLHSIEQIMANFFGDRQKIIKRFTGQLGSKYVNQSRKEDWVLEDSLMWWLRSLINFSGDLEAGVHYGQARTGRECAMFELKFKRICFGSLGPVKSHFGVIIISVSNHFLSWLTLHSLAQKKYDMQYQSSLVVRTSSNGNSLIMSLLGECFKIGYQLISVFKVKASNWLPNVNAANKLKRRNISFFLVKKPTGLETFC